MPSAADDANRASECKEEVTDNAETVADLLTILKRHGYGSTKPLHPAAVSRSFDFGDYTLYEAPVDAGWDVEGYDESFSATDTAGRKIIYHDGGEIFLG